MATAPPDKVGEHTRDRIASIQGRNRDGGACDTRDLAEDRQAITVVVSAGRHLDSVTRTSPVRRPSTHSAHMS
jgi:hypothetical protein